MDCHVELAEAAAEQPEMVQELCTVALAAGVVTRARPNIVASAVRVRVTRFVQVGLVAH